MAKSPSPVKTRGRPKAKTEKADSSKNTERPKSKGRTASRGRSTTPKGAKARAPSATKRSASKSRARSQTRKSEPKQPRARSSSRRSVSRKSAPAVEKEDAPAPTKVSRRTVAAREASKSVVDSPAKTKKDSVEPSKVKEGLKKVVSCVANFGYRRTLSSLFWLISMPVFVLGLHLLCSKDKCYVRFDPTIPKSLKVYFDVTVLSYGCGLYILQLALSALPIGKVVQGFGYRRATYQYRSNSFFCLVVTVALYLAATFYFKLPNTQILQTHRFKCVCGAALTALVVSVLLYVKSFWWGGSYHLNHGSPCCPGITQNHIHDFVHGREISPKIGKTLDFGLNNLRTANAIWVLAIISALIQAKSNGPVFGWSVPVAMVAGFQLVYVLAGSLNEVFILKSAFINQGVGFLSTFTTFVLVPFCSTLPLRQLVDNKGAIPEQNVLTCLPFVFMFVIGIIFIHFSNALKYQNARIGGKLLRNATYKIVRHPNYLGELICILAWTLPSGMTVLIYGQFMFTLALIICRVRQLEKNTNAEYKSYQTQVTARFLPFIY